MSDIIVELLDKSHQRKQFDCGVPALNQFIQQHARQNQNNHVSKTFVATPLREKDQKKDVLGYYALTSAQIDHTELPTRARHPRYPVAVVRLGRLAVTSNHQGSGLGGFLLFDALSKVRAASEAIGIYAMVVDAKDEKASGFYQHYGFTPLQSSALTLYLPMSVIENL